MAKVSATFFLEQIFSFALMMGLMIRFEPALGAILICYLV